MVLLQSALGMRMPEVSLGKSHVHLLSAIDSLEHLDTTAKINALTMELKVRGKVLYMNRGEAEVASQLSRMRSVAKLVQLGEIDVSQASVVQQMAVHLNSVWIGCTCNLLLTCFAGLD